jgi:molybdopterin-guanine dinucleotide biosynthesis protein
VIVVVGGSGRKVGKTTVACEIIAATAEARWTAIKITPHAHEPSPHGDTERYLAAGATNALLVGGNDVFTLPAGNVLIESNSILDVIEPDLFVFVEGAGEWKCSALHASGRAQFVVQGHATAAVIDAVRQLCGR